MADDSLSLLFRLRGDSSGVKTASAEARAAVNQLKQSFGPELTQTITVANRAFASLQDNLTGFVSQRLPIANSVFVRVTEGLKSLGVEAPKTQRAVASVANSIEDIATKSGKSIPQIASFLTRFIQLEGQAARNDAAFKFFGGSVDLIGNKTAKFVPELEKVGAELAVVSGQSVKAGSSIAAMAGPIGIAVLALAALAAGAVIAAKELFDLSKRTAEFQGHMFDLAQQTGIAVETLSAFEVLAKTTGGNLASITQALVLFQRKLDDAQDPLSKTAEQFRKFNIDTTDTENSLRSAFNALAAMPEGFAQTNAAAELFGARGGKQVLAILKESGGDLDAVIKRLRDLGILITDDAARAADKFNDELALLDFEVRALGAAAAEELIPALTEIVRSLGEMVTAVRPLISLFSTIAGPVARQVAEGFKGLSIIVQALTQDYKGLAKSIKEAKEQQEIFPLQVPGVKPTPLPGAPTQQQATSERVNAFTSVLAIVKRQVSAEVDLLNAKFQSGLIARDEYVNGVIAGNRRVLHAERELIDAQLQEKEDEIELLDKAQRDRGEIVTRDTEQYRAITAQVVKLQQERLDKQAEFDRSAKALIQSATKERADARRKEIEHETETLVKELDDQGKEIEAAVKRGATPEIEGLALTQALEKGKVDARIEGLQKQKQVGLLTIEEQKDLNRQIERLQQERDHLDSEHQRRRLERERAIAERARDIQLANIDALLEVERIRAERLIASNEALAAARIRSEEEVARKILAIRLGLIDSEIEATETRLKAASSIVDVDERIRTETDLTNRIKVLKEQRVTIEAQGDRDIEAGRQRDLENERRYADDLKDIKQEIIDVEREAAEEILRPMILHFASRRDIIRQRLRLDVEDENARHRNALDSIRALEQENRESNKTQEEKLEFEKEINRLREVEAERHRLVLQGIKEQAKKDEKETTPFGKLGLNVDGLGDFAAQFKDLVLNPIEALIDAFRRLQEAAKDFVAAVEPTIVPLGNILKDTFFQVADAIGQTVANWVLLGETGPAVMRKILAQALASVAAEAAVNAIKELALGFATLFFNPAESAAHFTAAALWGSIAGVAAIAGRGVAGDLFKSKSSSGSNRDRDSARGSGQLDPLTLNRNQAEPRRVVVEVRSVVEVRPDGSKLGEIITAHVIEDGRTGGPIRQFNIDDQLI